MQGAKERGMFRCRQDGTAHAAEDAVASNFRTSLLHHRLALLGTAVLGASLLLTSQAVASDRGEIRLRGVVPTVCTLSISTDLVEMDIVGGASAMPIATVTEQCNAAAGYTINVASTNSGRMVAEQGGTGIPYSLAYDRSGSTGAGRIQADRPTSAQARQSVLSATLPANPQAQAGIYSDTVTVSIIAK